HIKYMFCGIPFPSRTKLEGHAVRAMYACCGATDYYLETGDQAYWKTLNTLWEDLTRRQMYITGGVGARAQWEAFGAPYELPNAQAYGESCAAIGNMMWNWRMLSASGEARFADVTERAQDPAENKLSVGWRRQTFSLGRRVQGVHVVRANSGLGSECIRCSEWNATGRSQAGRVSGNSPYMEARRHSKS